MENVTIRNAVIEDLRPIQDISHELFISDINFDTHINLQWAYEDDGENEWRERIENHNKFLCLVAEIDNEIIGCLAGLLCDEDSYRPLKRADLRNIYVRKEHRHKGIGNKLTQQFIEWAKEKGAKKMSVETYAGNSDALEFYKEEGFLPVFITLEADIM